MVRQLTAIMFTDMVGYTALMQDDESEAKRKRDAQRDVLERAIEGHGGRILQFYGDGTLSVFTSAVSAVRSAVEIQESLRGMSLPLRIGIHSGDIVYDENGVFGHGVNVAARIEGLGVPGAVLMSGKVHDDVRNHPEIRTRSLGSFELKNVKHPMPVFAVVHDSLSIPPEDWVRHERAVSSRSVAVLPFVSLGAVDEDHFCDGLAEELAHALGAHDDLKVVARTSTRAFRAWERDVREIGRELDVAYVVEGSVRRRGGQVRVSARLVDVQSGFQLCSEVHRDDVGDLFAAQERAAHSIAMAVAGRLAPMGRRHSDGGRRAHLRMA
jgi:TolB-like protein